MEKQEYEKSVLEYEDVKEAMEYHHRMGRTEGFEKGYDLGVEQGFEQGRTEGIRSVIKRMLENNMDLSVIAKVTGLAEDEIQAKIGC